MPHHHRQGPLLALLPLLPLLMASARPLRSRNLPTNDTTSFSQREFDYVIVGGGLGGLVTASRLSQDPSVSVLVVEAGGQGDDVSDRVDIPAMAYYDGVAVPGSPYDWAIYTEPDQTLGNRSLYWPRARILGGCTAVNGQYMTRGPDIEQDAWAGLIADQAWNASALRPYAKRFETFHVPDKNTTNVLHLDIDRAAHGEDGPVQLSYPLYEYPQNALWQPTWQELGFNNLDAFSGKNVGGFITPNTIDPASNTRSYARSAYLDPVADQRQNLFVLTDFMATAILFNQTSSSDAKPRAVGLTLATTLGGNETVTFNVSATREVILAAGVIGTPKLLQLSGVGPAALLERHNISVVQDLPGVGQHLTDHLAVSLAWNTTAPLGGAMYSDADFRAEQLELYKNDPKVSVLSTPNGGVGWIDIFTLFGDQTDQFLSDLQANITQVNDFNFTDTVVSGYNATYANDAFHILPSKSGVVEILLGNTGPTLQLQLSHQHPFSRGTVEIRNSNPWDPPNVRANYLSHPADLAIMRQAIKFMRKFAATEPFSSVVLEEVSPGSNVTEDADIEAFIRQQSISQYHPAGSCAMLPLDMGGVVDSELKVYGIDGLRIVDASVIGIPMAVHHMQPLYALAEKASDMIRGFQSAASSPDATASESKTSGAVRTWAGPAYKSTMSASPYVVTYLSSAVFASPVMLPIALSIGYTVITGL